MSDPNVFTVPDPEGDYFYQIQARISAGQMIFTIRKHDNETGELVSSTEEYENRFKHRYASEYENDDSGEPTPVESLLDEDDYAVMRIEEELGER